MHEPLTSWSSFLVFSLQRVLCVSFGALGFFLLAFACSTGSVYPAFVAAEDASFEDADADATTSADVDANGSDAAVPDSSGDDAESIDAGSCSMHLARACGEACDPGWTCVDPPRVCFELTRASCADNLPCEAPLRCLLFVDQKHGRCVDEIARACICGDSERSVHFLRDDSNGCP